MDEITVIDAEGFCQVSVAATKMHDQAAFYACPVEDSLRFLLITGRLGFHSQ